MANAMLRPCVLVYDPLGDFAELSNFYPAEFTCDGLAWRSVEHYYQAAKFSSSADKELIRACSSASDARDLAWGHLHAKVRPDWDEIRVAVMRHALQLKFEACETARRKLLSTWPYPIAEDSDTDSFWGLGPDSRGRNTLGAELAAVRRGMLDLPSLPICFDGPSHTGRAAESRISAIDCTSYEIADLQIPLDPSALASINLASTSIDDLMADQLLGAGDPPAFGHLTTNPAGEGHRSSSAVRRQVASSAPLLLAALSHDTLLRLRGCAFDRKYGGYRWAEDARSAVRGWSDRFLEWLGERLPAPAAQTRGIVVGAGAGDEAEMVWSRFPGRLLLVDIGQELVANCRRQHPDAETCCTSAEELAGIGDTSFDFYCSLRTYQSVHFECEEAIAEARRVLRPNGLVVISVSDAYLRADGCVQRGQIVGERIDLSAGLGQLCSLSDLLVSAGFRSIGFHSFETELVVFGYLGALRPPFLAQRERLGT